MRDDIHSLPIPKAAKAYARRSGLKAMLNQPAQFSKVNAELTNPGKPNKVVNYDVGSATDGSKPAPKTAFKESAAHRLVQTLLS